MVGHPIYQIKMRYYMDKRDTPPKRINSPTWGSLPPCKQTLCHYHLVISVSMKFYYYEIRIPWISLLHHVCNQHEWADGHCDHKPITEENHQLPWFDRRSKEFEALQKIILDPDLLESFKYYSRFRYIRGTLFS